MFGERRGLGALLICLLLGVGFFLQEIRLTAFDLPNPEDDPLTPQAVAPPPGWAASEEASLGGHRPA